MPLQDKLKQLIDESNFTVSEISNITKIPNSTLSGILNGKFKNISIQKVKLICDVLGCSLDYLLDENVTDKQYGLNTSIKSLDEHQSKLVDIFNQLNKNYKQLALSQMETILEFQNSKEDK